MATLVAALAGLIAVVHGGLPILMIGVASVIAAWAYSSGPRPIPATPLGELFVVAAFGVAAVTGIEWLAVRAVSIDTILVGLGIGLPAAAVLTVANHRDRIEDARNGRRTLAILLGERASIALQAVELVAAVALLALAAPSLAAAAGIGFGWVPAAILADRLARMPVGRALNSRLAATAGFQLLLAGLTAAVWLGAS